MRRLFIALLACLGLASCSVFDDRADCPSRLTVWYDLFPGDVESAERNLYLTVKDINGIAYSDPVNADDYPQGTVIEVGRGPAIVSAYTGVDVMERQGDVLVIPDGMECDSLYLHIGYPDCCEDEAEDHVQTHKQFCNLRVIVEGGEVWEGDGLWSLFSNWNGLDVFTGQPVEGNLTSYLRYIGDGVWEGRIIRQGDDSLILEFTGPTGEPIHIDLGQVMADAGYDWTAIDLEDFTIYIRLAEGGVVWSIAPWEDGGDHDVCV